MEMKDLENSILFFSRYYIKHEHEGDTLITPELVVAIAHTESGLNPYAVRYEPKYRWLYRPDEVKPEDCSIETEKILQKTSWGVMQVMGAVAREYGYVGWLTQLLDIHQSVLYGVKHLFALERRGKANLGNKYTLDMLISDYNDGDWRRLDNKTYVQKVWGWLEKIQGG